MFVAVPEPGNQRPAGGVNHRSIRSDQGIEHRLIRFQLGRLICGAEVSDPPPFGRDHPALHELTRVSDKSLPTLDDEVCRLPTQGYRD